MAWSTTTIDGVDYLVVDVASFRIPLEWDPSSNMFIAVAEPAGGIGSFPALVQGDPGLPPTFDTPTLHPLAYGDSTPDAVTFTLVTPATTTTGPVYHAEFWLHTGAPGADGTMTILDATDLTGTPTAKQILVVNSTADGMVFQAQKVGDRYIPATINSAPTGNAPYLLCQVSVPAQDFDWRPEVEGYCIITGTASDVQVDLICRLNNASSGNEVGRAAGLPGINPPTHVLFSGPPPGSADSFDKISAGSAATIYLRAERQNGTGSFSTSATTTRFKVRVQPVP